ncbi:MAG: hypothetical protein ACRERR_07185 [Moraxellaceae bacterium]
MEKNISIISRLKKIALTSADLGREIAKEKANQVSNSLRGSRAGQLLESTRERLDHALSRQQAGNPKAKAVALKRSSGKHRLGADKYSAKTARLSHN